MVKLTKEAKRIINDFGPSFIATASKSGAPIVSTHGFFRVLDDTHVVFAEVASPHTAANLKENPKVSAIIYERSTRRGCRITGEAEIMASGKLFDDVSAPYAERGINIRHVVKVVIEEAVTFQSGRFYFYEPDEV